MANSNDKRFSHVRFEKKYVGAPQKLKQKLQVDSRFKSIFDGKKFKSTCSTDSRGHPLSIKGNSLKNLKEFYNLESDEDEEPREEGHEDKRGEDCEEEEVAIVEAKKKLKEPNKFDDSSSEEDEENEDGDDDEEEEEEKPDFARGQGNEESSSSDDSSSEDENEEEIIHAWAELDANVPETKEITRRLAVCNMNWDRMNAQDLMVVLNSFKNPEGCIQSVKIYKSQYGIQRLHEEELKGPKELANGDVVVVENEDDDEAKNDSAGEEDINEKIRQYQLSRLKYFYAVVECDTPETANKIYEECDGLEYESSACRFDMRFIPDDMSFDDEEPTSVAENIVDTTTYQPKFFTTDALNLGKVSLTWDETDPEREQVFKRAFESGDMEEMDLKVYLASSEEEDDGVASGEELEDEQSQIAKYRALLQSIDEQKKDDDTGLEMTWGTDLQVKTEELVKKKVMEKTLTPWEKYLEKKRGKVIEKRLKKTVEDSVSNEDENVVIHDEKQKVESDNLSSDDELPDGVDLDDPYFKLDDEGFMPLKKEKRKKKLKKRKVEETEEDKNKRAELELLLMNDEDDDKHHFNLKDILLKDNPKKKKKLMKKMKETEKNKYEDGFTVNVDDPRFEALYSSHLYNIDPSEPNFTKTKAMQSILEEKQKRRSKSLLGITGNKNTTAKSEGGGASSVKTNPEISMMVKSIKSKSQNFNKKK